MRRKTLYPQEDWTRPDMTEKSVESVKGFYHVCVVFPFIWNLSGPQVPEIQRPTRILLVIVKCGHINWLSFIGHYPYSKPRREFDLRNPCHGGHFVEQDGRLRFEQSWQADYRESSCNI